MTDALQHLYRAESYFEQDRYAQAEKEYREYLSQDIGYGPAHRRLALCLAAQNKMTDALKESGKALELEPNEPYSHYTQAHILRRCGKYKEAEAALEQAMELDPDNFYFFLEGANLYRRQKKFDQSITFSSEAIRVEPENYLGYFNKAWALFGKGKWREAEPLVNESLRLKPDSAETHALLGFVYAQDSKPLRAIQAFREALRLDPTSELAREGLLKALRSRNPLYGVLAFFTWFATPRLPFFFSGAAPWLFLIWLFFLSVSLILRAIAPHLLNLCMRFDPVAKHALNEDEINIANVLALWLAGGYVATILLFAFGSGSAFFAPMFFLLFCLPFMWCRIYELPEGRQRQHVTIFAYFTAGFGLLAAVFSLLPKQGNLAFLHYQSTLFTMIFIVLSLIMRFVHASHARRY